MLANGQVGSLANYFETTNVAGVGGGGLYTQNGFPQNFFVLNPQFATVNLYDSSSEVRPIIRLQVQVRTGNTMD